MPSRSQAVYIDDMRKVARRVLEYTAGLDYEGFSGSQIVVDAVLRNFEILGEAANHVSNDIRLLAPDIDWQRIKDFRNVIAHFYSGVDLPLTWGLIQKRIPALLQALDALRGQVPDESWWRQFPRATPDSPLYRIAGPASAEAAMHRSQMLPCSLYGNPQHCQRHN